MNNKLEIVFKIDIDDKTKEEIRETIEDNLGIEIIGIN